MVQVAASMAQAASTALPPFWNIMAPAVAASGLPVIAIQWRACSGGLTVAASARGVAPPPERTSAAASTRPARRTAGVFLITDLLVSRPASLARGAGAGKAGGRGWILPDRWLRLPLFQKQC